MNSESGRKSPQELKNQARQALREAERTVSQVTVMEHNWVGLINCVKMQIQMMEDMMKRMELLATKGDTVQFMEWEERYLKRITAEHHKMAETYLKELEKSTNEARRKLEDSVKSMQRQAGSMSDRFSKDLYSTQEELELRFKILYRISLIPGLILLLLELIPHIFSLMLPG